MLSCEQRFASENAVSQTVKKNKKNARRCCSPDDILDIWDQKQRLPCAALLEKSQTLILESGPVGCV